MQIWGADRVYYGELKNSQFSSRSSSFPIIQVNTDVVVQFYPWFKFYFPLFWGMVMYDNEFETKEIKI